jgi:hypothetical protein
VGVDHVWTARPSGAVIQLVFTRIVPASCLLLCGCLACAAKPGEQASPPPTAQAPAPACAPIDGIDAVVEAEQMIVFGEIHGTVESPKAFGDAVCHVVARHGRVVVALEIGEGEQQRIDAFMAGTGSGLERTVLLSGKHWVDEFQDGRRSVAMADLLERLRALHADGARIEVVAFDTRAADMKDDGESRLAERLATVRASHPDAPFLVLVGNIHPRTAEGAPWDAKFSPMGRRLVERGVEVLPIDLRHTGGSAWVCTGATADSCGAQKLSGAQGDRAPRRLELFATPDDVGYHGALQLGPITASPPALAAVAEDAPR